VGWIISQSSELPLSVAATNRTPTNELSWVDTARSRRQDLTALSGRTRRTAQRRIQMIFQDPYLSLNPRLIVAEPIVVHKLTSTRAETSQQVAELLQRVGLSADMMHRFPGQFSGGQRQRIGIARALASKPEVIICDEPVSALDLSVRAQILNLLPGLRQQTGVALLFIWHDLSVVRQVCDRTAVMYLGRLVEHGQAEQVHSQPAHPYTQALLSAVPVIDPAERGGLSRRILLPGDPPSPISPPSGCRFRTLCRLASDVCAGDRPPLEPVAEPVTGWPATTRTRPSRTRPWRPDAVRPSTERTHHARDHQRCRARGRGARRPRRPGHDRPPWRARDGGPRRLHDRLRSVP
jgi:oligopeptide/dipeptide ABC transporter ATP-binding protein